MSGGIILIIVVIIINFKYVKPRFSAEDYQQTND
jgi:hypothetical protein